MLLRDYGYSWLCLIVCVVMGGFNEVCFDGIVVDWLYDVLVFNLMVVECIVDEDVVIVLLLGLLDECFDFDGMMIK